jgi:hypothetical protein
MGITEPSSSNRFKHVRGAARDLTGYDPLLFAEMEPAHPVTEDGDYKYWIIAPRAENLRHVSPTRNDFASL